MRSRSALPLLAGALLACASGPAVRPLASEGGPAIHPFTSDGCTLSPDGKPGNARLWCSCCFAHDIAYWRGGTEAERLRADEALRACVLEKSQDSRIATLMYEAVRLGGSASIPSWYRWGYGWPYGRGYEPLTDRERALVERALADYARTDPGGYCARK